MGRVFATLFSIGYYSVMKNLCASIILLISPLIFASTERPSKTVILGFDGVDYSRLVDYMERGHFPNLKKLAEQGSFTPILPPVPAQTPVSWSTFTTGLHPGEHQIFDFLKRDIETYMPTFAIADEITLPFLFGPKNGLYIPVICFSILFVLVFVVLKIFKVKLLVGLISGVISGALGALLVSIFIVPYLPQTRPGVDCHLQGIPFWEALGGEGISTKIIRMPVTFPARSCCGGHLLSGLGVPDLSGRIGKPFFFTSDLFIPLTGENEFSVEVVELPDNRGEMDVTIVGPPNKLFDEPDYISIPMKLIVAKDQGSLTIRVCGQDIVLKPGDWSGWVDFTFSFNPLVKVNGIGRFYLTSLEPELNLYLSPINFDPRRLPMGISITYPRSWAKSLVDRFGLYKTIGWSVDTWSPSEELTDEDFFMDEWRFDAEMFANMVDGFMDDDDEVLFQYFEFTDRVGHIFFRYLDEGHPAYNREKALKYGDALLESYQTMDRIVGMVMEKLPEKSVLMVLSDHGFASFRYAVNYNTWLVQNGYMVLTGAENIRQDLYALFDQGQFWPNVDWSRTRAYSMGLGSLYINLKGRESRGIVTPGSEYEELKRELQAKMEGWVDEATGLNPVAKVYSREEAYGTFNAQLIPDLIVTNNPYYRVSWQTSLGGIPSNLIEENAQVWSGDHCSLYPPAIPGIFFSNIKIMDEETPFMGDIYPTILELYGVAPPYELPGKSLLNR